MRFRSRTSEANSRHGKRSSRNDAPRTSACFRSETDDAYRYSLRAPDCPGTYRETINGQSAEYISGRNEASRETSSDFRTNFQRERFEARLVPRESWAAKNKTGDSSEAAAILYPAQGSRGAEKSAEDRSLAGFTRKENNGSVAASSCAGPRRENRAPRSIETVSGTGRRTFLGARINRRPFFSCCSRVM